MVGDAPFPPGGSAGAGGSGGGGGRTKAAYRFYFDRGVAHVGTLKKHAFDPTYEAFKALAAWPCSGVTLALHDPKPAPSAPA
jgi:hypothetical protein